jgi:hypothetical protein
MADDLKPASPDDVAQALAFTLRCSARKRVRDSAEIMAAIVAKRLSTISNAKVAGYQRCGPRKRIREGVTATWQVATKWEM